MALKPTFFRFVRRLRAPGPCPKPSPGLEVEFPGKKCVIWIRFVEAILLLVVLQKNVTLLFGMWKP